MVPIQYLIDWSISQPGESSLPVEGFAFETPEWPEFHACVRRVTVGHVSELYAWVADHFESGLRVKQVTGLRCKEDAPAALKKELDRIGRKKVLKCIGRYK